MAQQILLRPNTQPHFRNYPNKPDHGTALSRRPGARAKHNLVGVFRRRAKLKQDHRETLNASALSAT